MNRNDSDAGGRAMDPMPPGFNSKKKESENGEKLQDPLEWDDHFIHMLDFLDEDDMNPATPDESSNAIGSAEASLNPLYRDLAISEPGHSNSNMQTSSSAHHTGGAASYADVLRASLSRSSTSDPQHIGRVVGGSNIGAAAAEQNPRTAEYSAQVAAVNDPSVDRNYIGNSYIHLLQKTGASSPHYYYGNPLASPVLPNSAGGSGSHMRHGDFNTRFPGELRNVSGSFVGLWHRDGMDSAIASPLLEDFKSNKARCFELSDISGHVVAFSADQYGSQFIQKKLETATTDEKNMVFQEIFPPALELMTHAYGNYVIQKCFELGMASQRRELADKLFGHVLTFSLEAYGCKVIQKAIEVVDLDQKIKIVQELEAHVMRCVRDRNGNYVIQKCIECIPEKHIWFIVSTFFGKVVALSNHSYGCYVIQRVLEHCTDETTQGKVMEEILGDVCTLAENPYGNYVVKKAVETCSDQQLELILSRIKVCQNALKKYADGNHIVARMQKVVAAGVKRIAARIPDQA